MALADWILGILAVIVGLYIYGTWTHKYFKKRNFPYAKSLRPFLGNFSPMVFKKQSLPNLINAMYDAYKGYKYVGFFEFRNPAVMIRDPEVIKMITVKDFDHFADRVVSMDEDVDSLLGKTLLSLEGQRWKDMRGTLSPAFTSSKMKAMFVLISESGEQLANHLEKGCKGTDNGLLEVDSKDLFTRYTSDVIATAAFGLRCDSLENPTNEFYKTAKKSANMATTMRVLIFLAHRICPSVMKLTGVQFLPEGMKRFFRSLIVGTMEIREREGIVRPDMIHLMMQARKGTLSHEGSDDVTEHSTQLKPGKKIDLSDEDITAQSFLFFLGGFDTSSTHLCFLSHLVATHPDVQRRLQEEIDETLAANGGSLTYDGVQSMKYLDMCMSEALRLWPPGPVTNRQCVKPYVLPATENTPSFKIDKGFGVWIPIMAIHLDPEYFPNPERFDPERFSDENKHTIKPYTYMPWGTGPRNCIGMRFALMEAKVAMIYLLSKFNLEATSKTPKTLRLDAKASFNMTVEGGFWIGIRQRT